MECYHGVMGAAPLFKGVIVQANGVSSQSCRVKFLIICRRCALLFTNP